MSNNLSLKVTLLKFEIRGIISKIVDRGMSREEAIAELMRALLERKAMLEGTNLVQHVEIGDEVEQNLAAALADTAIKPFTSSATSTSIRSPTVKVTTPGRSRLKSKVKTVTRKGQSGLTVEGVEVESDGRYIRRTEAEAVELLLFYISTC